MPVMDQVIEEHFALYNGDCCEVVESVPDRSVHMSVYSPPFALESGKALYCYSSSDRDFSNNRTYAEFMQHFEFLVSQMHRILLPGRIVAVHCMDVPKKGANICGYHDYPGDIIRLHQRLGFDYLPRICIWKEPLAVRNRTMSKALAHRQIVEDACATNVAAADYLIPFRKHGDNPVPVTHEYGLTEYAGDRAVPESLRRYKAWKGKQTDNRYSHWIWRQYASCFWDDIRLDNVVPFEEARDEEDERHQHPLQLDVIERCIQLWTNPGETVFTPFMGVGSEVYGAVKAGRKGIGIELKPSYYRQAVKNVQRANEERTEQMELF